MATVRQFNQPRNHNHKVAYRATAASERFSCPWDLTGRFGEILATGRTMEVVQLRPVFRAWYDPSKRHRAEAIGAQR